MDRLLVLLVVVAATAMFSAWWRARDGRVVSRGPADGPWSALPVEAADVVAAVDPRSPLVLVEFTAPDCQPCRTTATLLHEVVADREDVTIATLDVGDALDLARAHRIMRAPTTLLVSHQGHLLGRVGGVPRRDELEALLDDASRQPLAV